MKKYLIYIVCLLYSSSIYSQIINIVTNTYVAPDWSLQGTIVSESPDATKWFMCSPSLLVLNSTSMLACTEMWNYTDDSTNIIYRSDNDGQTWREISRTRGPGWSTLFKLGDDVYMLGTTDSRSNISIRKSTNEGITWSAVYTLFTGYYSCAPEYTFISRDKIWKAYSKSTVSTPAYFTNNICVISASIYSDLTNSASWSKSNEVQWNKSWRSTAEGWNEPMCVEGQNDTIAIFAGVRDSTNGNVAAILTLNHYNNTLAFDKIITFPGGEKKFEIFKSLGPWYYAVANAVKPMNTHYNMIFNRSSLALMISWDMESWEVINYLVWNPWFDNVAYQYPSIYTDGPNLKILSRTAYKTQNTTPDTPHNNNLLTYHSFTNVIPLY